jgi:uncharacterized membrane protein
MSNRPKVKPQVPVPKTGNVGIAQSFHQSFHHGPLPSPETLNGYETAFKGAAERIFIMAEKEQSGRLDIEKKMVNGEIIGEYVGQGFGFIIAMTGVSLFLQSWWRKDIRGLLLFLLCRLRR